ncbi:TPA: ferrous iron transport protein B [bacterium]|nr:ferrous iron transport protein B [bacterium]
MERFKTILLVGNPNVGKSVIFNKLTGKDVTVSNYPGTTVDISSGIGSFEKEKYRVLDSPGMNSLISYSEDEEITKNLLKERPDLVIQIGDAKNLRRALHLFFELTEIEMPMILCLNMSDEAKERGIRTDAGILEELLGIPVVATVAITGEGINNLKLRIKDARIPKKIVTKKDGALAFDIYEKEIDGIVSRVQKRVGEIKPFLADRLGNWAMKPFPGYVILIAVLCLMYIFLGKFAARICVGFLEELFEKYINPFLYQSITSIIPAPFIVDALSGEYGVFTMAIRYSFAIIFPIVFCFFVFFGILEDSGYLPRLCILLDKAFRLIGLNGKAVLPMVLGLGCGAMAVISTRILSTKKERLIAVLLLSLAIPCSAQLGIIFGILSGISFRALLIWLFVVIFLLILVGHFSEKVLSGAKTPFLLEVPPIRIPSVENILMKTRMRLVWYLREVIPFFVLATFILFLINRFNILSLIEWIFSPIVVNWLCLPARLAEVFIVGFLRRDYGAAGLYVLAKDGLLTPSQIVVSLVVLTLFVPCFAQFLVLNREVGIKKAFFIFFFTLSCSFFFGGILNFFLKIIRIV